MATCIVCNAKTESEYEELYMATSRNRLQRVMEEAIPEDSVICSSCQSDLEQIEMYYCLLNAVKMRYHRAAELRRNLQEGQEASGSQNLLADTVFDSTANNQDLSEGIKAESVFPVSMYSVTRSEDIIPEPVVESAEPLGIEILDVRSLQEEWPQVPEPPGDESVVEPTVDDSIIESYVEEDQTGDGLDLGCWSEGSYDCENGFDDEQQLQGGSLMVTDPETEYQYHTAYYSYDGFTLTDQGITDDSAPFTDALPVVPVVNNKRKARRPRKIKHKKYRKLARGDLSAAKTSQKIANKITASTAATAKRKPGRPRKKKPGRPRGHRGDLISGSVRHGTFQNNRTFTSVRGLSTSKRRVGRPRKNPLDARIQNAAPKRPVGRPRKKAKKIRVGAVSVPESVASVRTSGEGGEGARFDFLEGKKLVVSLEKLDLVQGENKPSTSTTARAKDTRVKSHKAQTNHKIEKPAVIPEPIPSTNTDNVHEPDQIDDLPLSERVKKSKPKSRKKRHTYVGSRQCSHCGLDFHSDEQLIAHSMTHNDAKPFKCPTCGKGFSTRYYQITHTSFTHASDDRKKFVCTICGKAVITKSYLRLHMERHTGKLQYQCTVCNRACVSASAYKIHMLVHTGEKPHKCNQCGKAYRQVYPLRVHMLTHTGERPHKCDCGMAFRDKIGLKVHMTSKRHKRRLGVEEEGIDG